MWWNILFVWGGALLVVCGVLYTARQAIRRGRLSGGGPARPGMGAETLEPQGRSAGFSWKANWPGLALIAFGAVMLLTGAAV